MRQDYKVPITLIIVFAFILSGFLLFGTLDATQVAPPACEEQFKRECFPKKEGPKPGLICPSPRQPCPLESQSFVPFDMTERSRTLQPCPLETTHSRDNNKLLQEDR